MPQKSGSTSRPESSALDSRARLVRATEELLWERGVSGTTPRAVWERSATGQGSYYHHFPTKTALVHAALDQVVRRSLDQAAADLGTNGPLLQALQRYLLRPREAVKGCKIGRHASDHTVMTTPELTAVVQRYFVEIHALVEQAARDANDRTDEERGNIVPGGVSPEALADLVVATVQGGYVMARATGDRTHMDRATRALVQLLHSSSRPREDD